MNVHRSLRHIPEYPKSSLGSRVAIAFVAVLLSSTLLGGMLGLFEARSIEAATLAKASATTEVAAARKDAPSMAAVDGSRGG